MTIRDTNLPQVTNVAEHLHFEEEDVFADGLWCHKYALNSSSKVVDDVWILDNAWSYHICYIREFFCTFSRSNGLVPMLNDQPCKIEDVGWVKIRMFDGVNRTLTHVSFIPNMRKNLISLEMLNSYGLEWSSMHGVLYVNLSDKKVVLRKYKHNNMYLLEVTTICGEVHFTRSWVDMSHVWHSCLGHMSDRYVSLLDKKMLPALGKVDLKFCEHCIMGK